MTHFEHLAKQVPGLDNSYILDLGSGRGGFLIDAAQHGAHVVGLELSSEYIRITHKRAEEAGVSVEVTEGRAEALPFGDNLFDFINICEVVEHVENPGIMFKEVYRVLKPEGKAYISVPNRFGFKDQHFHLYFINWLPRFCADAFISIFGTHKNYSDRSTGLQRLKDMHYYTYKTIFREINRCGFRVEDMRELRIKKEFSGINRFIIAMLYPSFRTFYFDSFHLLLTKK